jgi:hypothetical protein
MVAMSAATKKKLQKKKKQNNPTKKQNKGEIKKRSHCELLFSVVSSAFTGTMTLLFTGSATLCLLTEPDSKNHKIRYGT